MTSANLWITIGDTLKKAVKDHSRKQVIQLHEKIALLEYQLREMEELQIAEREQLRGPGAEEIPRYKRTTDPTARIVNAVKEIASNYEMSPYKWQNIAVQIQIHLVPTMARMRNGILSKKAKS
jgi:hypothetical protein